MITHSYMLQIPKPCRENWHEMRPDDDGRYCLHCAKTVVDFTGMSDEQIIAFLENSQGKICGRLNEKQLSRALEPPVQYQPVSKLKEIFAAILLLFGTREAVAHQPVSKSMIVTPGINPKVPINSDKDSSVAVELRGKVIGNGDGEPLAYAVVNNYTTRISATADETGYFTIAANVGDSVGLAYIGFHNYSFRVREHEFKEYKLKELPGQLTGDVVIVGVPKNKKMLYKIRHFFHIHPKYTTKRVD